MEAQAHMQRAIHLIDFENLCGEPIMTSARAQAVRRAYMNQVEIGPCDQIVIATSRINALEAYRAWPGKRQLWRDGKDGADICLAEVILDEDLPSRFNRVVVASGDGGLADFVASLASVGTATIAVGKQGSMSSRMRMAAHATIELILEPESEAKAA